VESGILTSMDGLAASGAGARATSRSLLVRGFLLLAAGALCVVPIVIGSAVLPAGFRWAWNVAWLTIGVLLVIVAVATSVRAYRQDARQVRQGYTTLWKSAVRHPEVIYLDGRDGSIISGVSQRRPRSGRRADIEAAKAAERQRT
jgi:hypothetical protein